MRLDLLETTRRRDIDTGDISEPEEISEEKVEEETSQEKMVKMIVGLSSKPILKLPIYEGNLNPEELIDWISAMDKYFDYENIAEDRKVKFTVT